MARSILLDKQGTLVPQFNLSLDQVMALRPPEADTAPPLAEHFAAADRIRVPALAALAAPLRVRKNQKNMTTAQWNKFIDAIDAIAAPGAAAQRYISFVNVHDRAMNTMAGMGWGAHSMAGMNGRNFVAWHRNYLLSFENRLRKVDASVTIPYWDWINDRSLPAALSRPADLAAWNVTRGVFNAGMLPDAAWISAVLGTGVVPPNFTAFQTALESAHNPVHNAVGGTMATSKSPADPIFWLHHAMIDKLWADWQFAHSAATFNPPNVAETMKPSPIIARKVSSVLKTASLGYTYG